jgi:hypothetical protein
MSAKVVAITVPTGISVEIAEVILVMRRICVCDFTRYRPRFDGIVQRAACVTLSFASVIITDA